MSEPNSTPLGRLRLELKALGDAAAAQDQHHNVAHATPCAACGYFSGQSTAYYHAVDLVMALEREGTDS